MVGCLYLLKFRTENKYEIDPRNHFILFIVHFQMRHSLLFYSILFLWENQKKKRLHSMGIEFDQFNLSAFNNLLLDTAIDKYLQCKAIDKAIPLIQFKINCLLLLIIN